MTPEGKVQKYVQKRSKELGGLVRKIAYEGRRGAPDLLVAFPGGIIAFFEIKKSEDTEAASHQRAEHDRLSRRGANVFVIGSPRDFDSVVAKLLQ